MTNLNGGLVKRILNVVTPGKWALCVCLVVPFTARSQIAAPAISEVAPQGLEEIVVTARKREESIQDIPASITALSAADLARQDITSLEKLSATSPELVISRSPADSGAQIVLRGIGTNSTSIGVEQSVALIIDGAYYGQGKFINDAMFDLQRVELLKGPQVLFFGKNATAGVVSSTTANPTDKLEASALAGYEFTSKSLYSQLMLSAPITDTLGIRVAMRGTKMYGGYFTNDAPALPNSTIDVATGTLTDHVAGPANSDQPNETTFGSRVTVKWDPTEQLDFVFKSTFNRDDNDSPGWNSVPFLCPVNGVSQLNPAQPCSRSFSLYQNNLPSGYTDFPGAKPDGAIYDDYNSSAFNLEMNYKLPIATITSIVNYQGYDSTRFDDTDFQASAAPGSSIWADINSEWRALSAESRVLTAFDSPLNAMVGGYFQRTDLSYIVPISFAGLSNSAAVNPQDNYVGFLKDSGTNGRTWSGFTQLIWKVVPTVEADAGARYTSETKDSFYTQPYVNPALLGVFVENNAVISDQHFNNWSPEATVSWTPSKELMAFVAYKTGYKSGGFSNSALYTVNTDPAKLSFQPEKVKGYESGIKTTLLNNTLRLNANIYDYKYDNLQVDYFDSVATAFVTSNAGASRTYGIELDGEWAPPEVPGLTVRSVLDYNKAYYISFLSPCYAGETPAQGCLIPGAGGLMRPTSQRFWASITTET
jgi:outer membrane receptor protein involved in Fe transport